MADVFVVQHAYELSGIEEVKLIGVYSSRDSADAAVARMKLLPGFCDHPNCFHIDPYRLDEDHWTSGFAGA